MNFGQRVLGLFDSLVDRVLCVTGAVLFSQAPEFMQQYLQRLGGHLDEALRQLARFQRTAEEAGVTLDQLITQTAGVPDAAVARLGGVMAESVARAGTLQAAHDALVNAPLWARPFVFLRHLDAGIARATWSMFKPAVPTTAEGLVYALGGMLVLLALYHLALKRIFVTHRSKPAAPR